MAHHDDYDDGMDLDHNVPERSLRERPRNQESWTNQFKKLIAPASGSYQQPYGSRDYHDSQPETDTQRYKRQRNDLREQMKRSEEINGQLKSEIRSYKMTVTDVRESAIRVRQAMEDKDLFLGPQALDRTVRDAYNALSKKVRGWTRHLIRVDRVSLSDFSQDVRNGFEIVVPGLRDAQFNRLLADKSCRRYFFQGWLGYQMCKSIFPTLPHDQYPGTDTVDLWMDISQAQSLQAIETSFAATASISAREFNDWRSYSTFLIAKTTTLDPLPGTTIESIFELCEHIGNTVRPWSGEITQDMATELQSIVEDAVQLSKLLRTQRAQWSIRFPGLSSLVDKEAHADHQTSEIPERALRPSGMLQFDSSTMKSVEPHEEDERTDNKIVQIFITPALFKCGDADGEQFDVVSVIEPSTVLWSEIATPSQQQSKNRPQQQQQYQQAHETEQHSVFQPTRRQDSFSSQKTQQNSRDQEQSISMHVAPGLVKDRQALYDQPAISEKPVQQVTQPSQNRTAVPTDQEWQAMKSVNGGAEMARVTQNEPKPKPGGGYQRVI